MSYYIPSPGSHHYLEPMPYSPMGAYGAPAYGPMSGFGGYGYDTGYPMPANSYYGYDDGYYGGMYGRRRRHSYAVSLCCYPLNGSLFLNSSL